MPHSMNCPHCGGVNSYTGEEKTVQCSFCGNDLEVPAEVVQEVTLKKFSRKATTWIIVFVILVLVLPLCITFGSAILGVLGRIFTTIVTIAASFWH